MGEVVNLGL